MIYIENACTDPHFNLALEEYVFTTIAEENQGEPILILWQNEPSVIVGKYQNTIEEINYDYINEKGIHVVRRNTGGGAVYHDLGNLNYSFIIPDVKADVDFKTFTGPIVKALRSQGINAEQTGRNDILADGRKFSGNAQQFSRNRLLHHGTLMFDVNMEDVANSLKVKAGKFRSKATKSVRSRVTNLKPIFEENAVRGEGTGEIPQTAVDFKNLLLRWFDKEYDLREVKLTERQLQAIQDLKADKYDTHKWNFERSPKADVVRGDFFRCGQVEFHMIIDEHRISGVKIVGDFFASRDIEELETMLEGVVYRKEDLLQVLKSADLRSYLGDVTAEELVEVMV